MKLAAVCLGVLFVVVLAIVVGKQMSADAMAVVVGLVCGIGASIPTSLLMLFLLRGREEQAAQHRLSSHIPSVMIVNPPAGIGPQYLQPLGSQYLPPSVGGGPRQFEILGAEEGDHQRRLR